MTGASRWVTRRHSSIGEHVRSVNSIIVLPYELTIFDDERVSIQFCSLDGCNCLKNKRSDGAWSTGHGRDGKFNLIYFLWVNESCVLCFEI